MSEQLYYIDTRPERYRLISWVGEEVTLEPIDGGPTKVINGSFVYPVQPTKAEPNNE